MLPFFAELVIANRRGPARLRDPPGGSGRRRQRHAESSATGSCCWSSTTSSGTSIPICAAAASRVHRQPSQGALLPLRAHAGGVGARGVGHQRPGGDRRAARSTVDAHDRPSHTLALTGYNYWAADRRHPCSVLGMMYALEVIASVYGGPFSSAIRDSLLLEGDRGVSFISSHATMDAEHMAELASGAEHASRTTRPRRHRRIRASSTSITSRASSKPYERRRRAGGLTTLMSRPYKYIRLEWNAELRLRCGCAPASSRSSATASRRWPSCSRSSTTSRQTRGWSSTS